MGAHSKIQVNEALEDILDFKIGRYRRANGTATRLGNRKAFSPLKSLGRVDRVPLRTSLGLEARDTCQHARMIFQLYHKKLQTKVKMKTCSRFGLRGFRVSVRVPQAHAIF